MMWALPGVSVFPAFGRWLGDIVFPPRCGGCGVALRPGCALEACAPCVSSMPSILAPVCALCGAPFTGVAALDAISREEEGDGRKCVDCRGKRRHWSMARSFYAYEGPAKGMVTALKYSGRRRMAATMARLAWKDGGPAMDAVAGLACVVAVPLHRARMAARGYNQSAELAREIGALAGLAFAEGVLERVRDTRPQVGLKRAERRDNVRDAFAVARGGEVAGKAVLLVDDVMTTGATLEEGARALRTAGAEEVRALCFARDP